MMEWSGAHNVSSDQVARCRFSFEHVNVNRNGLKLLQIICQYASILIFIFSIKSSLHHFLQNSHHPQQHRPHRQPKHHHNIPPLTHPTFYHAISPPHSSYSIIILLSTKQNSNSIRQHSRSRLCRFKLCPSLRRRYSHL